MSSRISRKKNNAGHCYPSGATVFDEGVNFSLFSKNATDVELLLFNHVDDGGRDPIHLENRPPMFRSSARSADGRRGYLRTSTDLVTTAPPARSR